MLSSTSSRQTGQTGCGAGGGAGVPAYSCSGRSRYSRWIAVSSPTASGSVPARYVRPTMPIRRVAVRITPSMPAGASPCQSGPAIRWSPAPRPVLRAPTNPA